MTHLSRRPLAVFGCLLLLACPVSTGAPDGSGGGGGAAGGGMGGGGGGAGADAGYCEVLARAQCARRSACGVLDSAQTEACVDGYRMLCSADDARINSGRVTVSPARLQACIAATSAGTCARYLEGSVGDCLNPLLPAVPPGGACVTTLDCAGGTCMGDGGTCSGRCVAEPVFGGVGAQCNNVDRLCSLDAGYCGTDGGCVAFFADGVSCDIFDCSRQCAGSRFQIATDGGSIEARCGANVSGAQCFAEINCPVADYCSGQVSIGRCVPRAQRGAPCLQSDSLGGSTCLEVEDRCIGDVCVRVAAGTVAVGRPCLDAVSFDVVTELCVEGSTCIEGLCTAYLDAGAACPTTYPSGCRPEETCAAGVCRARSAESGPCDNNGHCKAGLVCKLGVCGRVPELGESCEGPLQCRRSFCRTDGGTSLCLPLLEPGEACDPLREYGACRLGTCEYNTGVCPNLCL